MTIDKTALSSLAASLDELTRRLAELSSTAEEDDDDRSELNEIERQLQTAARRLDKVVHRSRRR